MPRELIYLPLPVEPSDFLGESVGRRVAGHVVQRLMGFWWCWHAMGGRREMEQSGLWSRSGVWSQLEQFQELYGCGPDEVLPELAAALRRDASQWPARYSHGFPVEDGPAFTPAHR